MKGAKNETAKGRKSVFLTREAADAKLKELEGEDKNGV